MLRQKLVETDIGQLAETGHQPGRPGAVGRAVIGNAKAQNPLVGFIGFVEIVQIAHVPCLPVAFQDSTFITLGASSQTEFR